MTSDVRTIPIILCYVTLSTIYKLEFVIFGIKFYSSLVIPAQFQPNPVKNETFVLFSHLVEMGDQPIQPAFLLYIIQLVLFNQLI